MNEQGTFIIIDMVWDKVSLHHSGKETDCGVTAADNRLFLEAVLWRVRTGSPWRDLSVSFGNWNSIFQRFRRWVHKGVFDRIFEVLSDDPDFEYILIDGTIVSVTKRRAALKGDSKSSHRAIKGWSDHQNYGSGRCFGKFDPFHTSSRPTP